MKFWLGLIIFCAIIWYGASNLGWFDWMNADQGFWYETKQLFNRDNVKQRQIQNQKNFDRYY